MRVVRWTAFAQSFARFRSFKRDPHEKMHVHALENLIRLKKESSIQGVWTLTVAYVLAKVEAGKDQEVLTEVKKMSGVKQATPTYGVYDLHVEVSFETMDDLDKFIFDGIRRVPGIKETITLIAFKGI
jgi:DNA-binding Lrp family transcriptional regulator